MEKNHFKIILSAIEEKLIQESFVYICNILNSVSNVSYTIDTYIENLYEYRGIKNMYELAKNNPESIFLYIHTKGMYYVANLETRSYIERCLLVETITNHSSILDLFEENKNINRIGLFPDICGIMWYNFYFVTGRYLITCEDPKITDNRYYYELWLGSGQPTHNDSYSLYSQNSDYYSAITSSAALIHLSNKYL